jgi:signal transduction histidine kinase
MRSLRSQLILSHVLPFVLIMPLVGLVLLVLLEAQVMLNALSVDLQERAVLIAEALQSQPETLESAASASEFVRSIAPLVEGEFYLLDRDGRLLAASPGATVEPQTVDAVRSRTIVTEETEVQVEMGVEGQTGQATAPVLDVNDQLLGIVGVHQELQGLADAFSPLRRLVLLTVLGGMILGAIVGMLLARRLERPISDAVTAVSDIALGRSSAPLEPEGPIEVRELARSVNTLQERLDQLQRERQRSLANIVHELGRPLASVHTAIHVLRQGAAEDPAIRAELLDGVEGELQQMEPLLDDLALLHSETAGRQRLRLAPIALSEWLPAALLPRRAAALDKGLNWSASVPDDLPVLWLDDDRMGQVLGNLLGNAVKYTPAGGSVAAVAEASAGEVTIAITDTGPGIDPDEQERIFEPFYRGQNAKRFSDGLGIGLSIARGLVEAHGGTLLVSSEEGAGSTFTIRLPIDRPIALAPSTQLAIG